MGFRGEALAAISAVSKFGLVTRPADRDAGTELIMSGGKMVDVREAGCPVGTRISIKNLFFNVPARRKFLRTEKTESAHAKQYFLTHALAHPEQGLELEIDQRTIYNLPAGRGLLERIQDIHDKALAEKLRRIEFEFDGIEVTGYAGLPAASRSNRNEQYIFINGRPASAPALYNAINQSYRTLLPQGRHPILFLFLTLDPSEVDVNVHPTKKEVRFRRTSAIRDAVIGALSQALQNRATPSPSALPHAMPSSPPSFTRQFSEPIEQREDRADPFSITPPTMRAAPVVETQQQTLPQIEEPFTVQGESWANAKLLGQIGGLFVTFEGDDGLIVMDPHAAHERVLFEKFMGALEKNSIRAQGLLSPETFTLAPTDANRVRKNLPLLQEMGFGVADFEGDTFMVDAMPTYFKKGTAENIIREVANELEAGGTRAGTREHARDMIAMAACKAAVKASDQLSSLEIQQLVKQLAQCEMPYTCPHGRPSVIMMNYHELRRRFGRE